MSKSRRSSPAEYKVEATHRVIDTGRTGAAVARELGMGEQLLGRWVRDERVRTEAAPSTARRRQRHGAVNGTAPLTGADCAELGLLRRQVTEQEKDIAFLRKRRLCT